MCKTFNHLKSLINDNELFDERTGHKLTEVEGDVIELKYCTKCKSWYPIDNFYKNKSQKDGCTIWCKDCVNKNHKEKRRAQPTVELVYKTEAENTTSQLAEELKKEIVSLEQELAVLTEENYNLQEDNVSLQNRVASFEKERLHWKPNLTQEDVEEYLLTHNMPPRILFKSIREQDSRYTFFVRDNVSGAFCPIVREMAESIY